MTLRDVINAVGNRTDWINFEFGWKISDNGDLCPVLPTNINLDSKVDVVYYHYHHMMPTPSREQIWKAIEEHDYEMFSEWYDEFTYEYESMVYLPSTASIFAGEYYIGNLCIAYNPDVFSLITSQDCECG